MKYIIILMALFFSLPNYSQNYHDKFKADICSCIETKKTTLQIPDKIYNACFSKHMVTYAVFIDAAIKEEDRTKKFIAGQKVRRDLNQKFKYELAYICDAYVDIIEEKKQRVIHQIRSKKIDSSRIDKLNETVAMAPHWANYFNRGQFYYYIGNLQKAERDVLKSIEENPLNEGRILLSQEYLLLALIYEEQKQYSKAIAIYEAINAKVIIPSVALLKAIVSRKSSGYVFKPSIGLKTKKPPIIPKEKPNKILQKKKKKTDTITTRNQNEERNTKVKSKDSTKSLRHLFKLN